jgi:hypothetical protein
VENIKTKIHSYDAETHSIVLSFSSVINGVYFETPSYSYSTTPYTGYTSDYAIKEITKTSGPTLIEIEIKKHHASGDTINMDDFRSMVGNEVDVTIPQPTPLNPPQENLVDNLEVII